MNTPSSRVLWTSTLAALVFVALAACSAHAAAFQNLGPNSGWQYDAPAGVTIGNISDPDANNTVFTLSRTWTGLEPVTITFKVAANNQNEHFFWMNLDLTVGNAAWSGFDITLVDFYDQVKGNAFHPIWAHIHPSAVNKTDPKNPQSSNYAPFTTLTPSTAAGKSMLDVTGGMLIMGNHWKPTNIRLHDASSDGGKGPMQFDLILTPLPESGSTLLLTAVSIGFLAVARRQFLHKTGTPMVSG